MKSYLNAAVDASKVAGALLRKNLYAVKRVNSSEHHDIKLELDVRSQKTIERTFRKHFPEVPILGEEGTSGDIESRLRWVVDPIDGTVNYTYGIPHACVSIALQERIADLSTPIPYPDAAYETVVGVVYDPFSDELWTALKGQPARLNGKRIHVSTRERFDESIISIGFAKRTETLNHMLPLLNWLVHRARKIRIMGSASLAMTYVASGRNEAYVEAGLRLWDIAAAGLIIECAGGEHWREPMPGPHTYRIVANNGNFRRALLARLGKIPGSDRKKQRGVRVR